MNKIDTSGKGEYVPLGLVSSEASSTLASIHRLDRRALCGIEKLDWILSVPTRRILSMEEGGWSASNTPSQNGLGTGSTKCSVTCQGSNYRATLQVFRLPVWSSFLASN